MIRSLLHYNHVVNLDFINALAKNEVDDKKCISLMSHILNAQLIWNARVEGSKPKWKAWMIHEVGVMKKTSEEGYAWSMNLMTLNAPTLVIKFKNNDGDELKNSVQDVMLHIVNHATYHRGQLALRLKELGIAPPSSDFIHFQRSI